MNGNATAALPSAKGGSTAPRPRGRRNVYALLLLAGFGVATASFVGSTLYADARLERVAQRSHEVSDNAMPSIVALAAMQHELAHVELLLDESAEGDVGNMRELPAHWSALDEALRRYKALPQFPTEPQVWNETRMRLDDVLRIAGSIAERVEAGHLRAANVQVGRELLPAVREADAGLARLVELNHDQGRQAADEADAAWSRTRRLSILLDLLCVTATAGLALAAYLAFRKYDASMKLRNDELEGFAARVAHDIRGPLTPAVVALQAVALQPGPEGDARQRAAERGLRGLHRVEDMVTDLLTFARSAATPEAGASASLRAVVSGVVQDLETEASAARVEVRVEDLPACDVACARGVLTSIVLNLVSNAIKHFPADREPRRVVLRAAARGGRVRMEVADTGAGLAPDELARIFEPYVRLDTRCPGLGLGLATVRRLVESHTGTVGVRSPPGEGAVFWFEMPLRREPTTLP